MRFSAAIALLAALTLSAPPLPAQDAAGAPTPILTVDQDRLFLETRPALRGSAEIEAEALALAEENRRIEAELSAEERDLTERRPGLTPQEFTELADAFDAKVQRIRIEQDRKARTLAIRQEEARQAFLVEIGGILSEIVRERGAAVVLDRRDVFLSAERVDITDELIERVNARAAEADRQSPGAAPDASADPEQ